MRRLRRARVWVFVVCTAAWLPAVSLARAQHSMRLEERLWKSADLGQKYLLKKQLPNGAYPADHFATHPVGVTSRATLALSRLDPVRNDAAIRRSLRFLRSLPEDYTTLTSDVALWIMVLVEAGDETDRPRVRGERGGESAARLKPPSEHFTGSEWCRDHMDEWHLSRRPLCRSTRESPPSLRCRNWFRDGSKNRVST